jgi:hypothetical protein
VYEKKETMKLGERRRRRRKEEEEGKEGEGGGEEEGERTFRESLFLAFMISRTEGETK